MDTTDAQQILFVEPGEGQPVRDSWTVAFGNSFSDEKRCIVARYVNDDVKLFDLRTNSIVCCETNVASETPRIAATDYQWDFKEQDRSHMDCDSIISTHSQQSELALLCTTSELIPVNGNHKINQQVDVTDNRNMLPGSHSHTTIVEVEIPYVANTGGLTVSVVKLNGQIYEEIYEPLSLLEERIAFNCGIPPSYIYLKAGRARIDDLTMIPLGSIITVHLRFGLRGGGPVNASKLGVSTRTKRKPAWLNENEAPVVAVDSSCSNSSSGRSKQVKKPVAYVSSTKECRTIIMADPQELNEREEPTVAAVNSSDNNSSKRSVQAKKSLAFVHKMKECDLPLINSNGTTLNTVDPTPIMQLSDPKLYERPEIPVTIADFNDGFCNLYQSLTDGTITTIEECKKQCSILMELHNSNIKYHGIQHSRELFFSLFSLLKSDATWADLVARFRRSVFPVFNSDYLTRNYRPRGTELFQCENALEEVKRLINMESREELDEASSMGTFESDMTADLEEQLKQLDNEAALQAAKLNPQPMSAFTYKACVNTSDRMFFNVLRPSLSDMLEFIRTKANVTDAIIKETANELQLILSHVYHFKNMCLTHRNFSKVREIEPLQRIIMLGIASKLPNIQTSTGAVHIWPELESLTLDTSLISAHENGDTSLVYYRGRPDLAVASTLSDDIMTVAKMVEFFDKKVRKYNAAIAKINNHNSSCNNSSVPFKVLAIQSYLTHATNSLETYRIKFLTATKPVEVKIPLFSEYLVTAVELDALNSSRSVVSQGAVKLIPLRKFNNGQAQASFLSDLFTGKILVLKTATTDCSNNFYLLERAVTETEIVAQIMIFLLFSGTEIEAWMEQNESQWLCEQKKFDSDIGDFSDSINDADGNGGNFFPNYGDGGVHGNAGNERNGGGHGSGTNCLANHTTSTCRDLNKVTSKKRAILLADNSNEPVIFPKLTKANLIQNNLQFKKYA